LTLERVLAKATLTCATPSSPVTSRTTSSAILWATRRGSEKGAPTFFDPIMRNSDEVKSYSRISTSKRSPRVVRSPCAAWRAPAAANSSGGERLGALA
jgi:hypothetical protein